jgi:hypothetical protein
MKASSPLRLLLLTLLAATLSSTALAGGGPSISISASPTVITDQGEDTTFTLTASPPSSRHVAVKFVLTGTAFPGTAYTLVGNFNGGRIVFSPGQSFTTVTLHTFDVDGPSFQTAGITLLGGQKYHVGRPNRASVTIQNVR